MGLKGSKTGQALTELAIFGSILIFLSATLISWGMGQNYTQRLEMDAFRRAYQLNTQAGDSQWGQESSYVLVEDLPRPDPGNKFGFIERSPQAASAKVTQSLEMFGGGTEWGNADSLPRMRFKIGKQELEFTTAGFKEERLIYQGNSIETGPTHWKKQVGDSWQPVYLGPLSWTETVMEKKNGEECSSEVESCVDVTNYAPQKMYYQDENGNEKELTELMTADFDADGKNEMLMRISRYLKKKNVCVDHCSGSNAKYAHYGCLAISGISFIDREIGWRKQEDVPDYKAKGVPCWEWKDLGTGDLKKSMSADFDADDQEEMLLEFNDDAVQFLDYQEGEIDLTPDAEASGYKGEYTSTVNISKAGLTRIKNAQGINTRTSVQGSQTITHHLKTKAGVVDVTHTYRGDKDENF